MMNKLKKSFITLLLLNKRLLKKTSFILVLCVIPIITLAMTMLAHEQSGILHILLYAEDKNDVTASEIINDILEKESVILFEKCEDVEKAYNDVKTGNADAVWIFNDNLQQKIDKFSLDRREKNAFVTVIERETNVTLQLSHEELYGAVFPYISYSIFEDFLSTEVFTTDEITEEQVKYYYDTAVGGNNLVDFERARGDSTVENPANYLTAPLRGLLSLVVTLCGLAAVMYHQSDKENKIFDWLPKHKHIRYGFFTCFSAVFDSTVFIVIALIISNLFTGIREVLSAIVFVFAATAFCMLIGFITRKASVTGSITPFLMICMLVLSPIFFNLGTLQRLQMLFPTYYYLSSIYSPVYILYMAFYAVAVLSGVFILNYVTERNS